MAKALTDAEAIATVSRALSDYAEQVGPTASAAEREMSRTVEEISMYADECSRQIGILEQALDVLEAEEEPDYRLIEEKRRHLRAWQRKSEDTRRLAASVAQAHAAYRAQQRRYAGAIEPLVKTGRDRMRNAREDVIKFERTQAVRSQGASRTWRAMATGSSGGGASSIGTPYSGSSGSSADVDPAGGSPGDGPPLAVPTQTPGAFDAVGELTASGLPTGFVLIPLSSCVDEGRVRSTHDFDNGKGTAEDLSWGLQSLYSEVLPRMARGGNVAERLADTDAGRGNSGVRSLSSTMDGFFGSGALRVEESPGGRYEVVNGAHRIWLAGRLGMTHLPAQVRRGGTE